MLATVSFAHSLPRKKNRIGNWDMGFHHFYILYFLLLLPVIITSLAKEEPERCHPEDKSALLEFKKDLSNPYALASWTTTTDCCQWYVVVCDDKTNRIKELSLFSGGVGVAGSIPDAVGHLTHLQILRLHKLPNLMGHIPPSISNLTGLVSLDISWTNISGPIPSFLVALQNLSFLILSSNNLSCSIPPELARLPKLVGIVLDRNRLTGEIPESFRHFSNSVPDLILSHNRLSGKIPRSLGNLNFSRIDFSRDLLLGDASMLFSASKNTLWIDLSRSMLEFDFSGSEFPPNSFVSLDISHNRIFGKIPSRITEAISLQFLNVSYNRLCEEIPQGWKLKYRAENFDETSYLHNRCLCGPPLQACK